MIFDELHAANRSFEKYLKNFHRASYIFATLLNNNMQASSHKQFIGLAKEGAKCSKNLSVMVNLDAQTEIFHSEDDVSYTLISVPKQAPTHGEFYFMFQLNRSSIMMMPMNTGFNLTYCAKFVTHRQSAMTGLGQIPFQNLSSYVNKSLWGKATTTLGRLHQTQISCKDGSPNHVGLVL